jgi:RimJ/RimL family protein N-acetyltransferase
MFRFRPPTAGDAAMILDWRTRPDVTRYMFTDLENPDVERQKAWLAAMDRREDYRHFVIETGGRAIGYLSYSDIDRHNRRCSSGLYIALPADRARYGIVVAPYIFDYCFHALGMEKLINAFMEGNERLIRVQFLLGYREVGTLKRHVWKYGRWHDVRLLELLREAYDARPRTVPLAETLAAYGIDSADSP